MRYIFFDKLHYLVVANPIKTGEIEVLVNKQPFLYNKGKLYQEVRTKEMQLEHDEKYIEEVEKHNKKVAKMKDSEKAENKAPEYEDCPYIKEETTLEITDIDIIAKIEEYC